MKPLTTMLTGSVFSLLFSAQALAGPIEDLQPGHWYEVPASQMQSVAPEPYDSRVRNVMDAWSGGAFDTKRDRLIVWGGGHGDYWGNEIYVFDLNSLSWQRLNDPYYPAEEISSPDEPSFYPDGTPASRHTYDGVNYLPEQDRFWMMGGSRWPTGDGDRATAMFNFDTLKWKRTADAPDGSGIGISSAYDPVTGHIFVQNNGWFMEYDPIADSWRKRGADSSFNNQVGAIDPVNRLFVMVGRGEAYVFDLDSAGDIDRRPLGAVGATEIEGGQPGLAFDPTIGKIVAWNGGANVYTLDLSTSPPVWTRHAPEAGNSVIPTAANDQGTYGRWQYSPSKGVFVGVNKTDENVYIYKLSPSAAAGGGSSDPFPTLTFSASSSDIEIGSDVTLNWSSTNADGCAASGSWSGSKAASGTQVISSLTEDSSFTLTCSGAGGTVLRTVLVDIIGADVISPSLDSVAAGRDGQSVIVQFSEAVESGTAEDINNYEINNGVVISQANLSADQTAVTLETTALAESLTYTLQVSNIFDLASVPNVIAPGTSASFSYTDSFLGTPSRSNYEWDVLSAGAEMYVDRDYTFITVPADYSELEYLRTANDDKWGSGDDFLSFDASSPITIYIGYDKRNTILPTWLQSWDSTGQEISTSTNIRYVVYKKEFDSGTITLGGNEMGNSMYVAFVAPQSDSGDSGAASGDSGGGSIPGGSTGGGSIASSGDSSGGAGAAALLELLAILIMSILRLPARYRRNGRCLMYLRNTISASAVLVIAIVFLPSTLQAAEVIDIPVDTWVARAVPEKGSGPSGEMKHMRLAHNPDDGRIYFLGGDYSGPEFYASGRNEVYSYSILDDDWNQEQPYCRPDGGYQPSGADEVGWTYDTKRNLFWMLPGYQWKTSADNCADSSNILSGQIMAFDPITKKWTYERRSQPDGQTSAKKFALYDEATDSIIRFYWTGSNPRAEIYDIENDKWSLHNIGAPAESARLGWDYFTIDPAKRIIYMVSPLEGRLLTYDMDTRIVQHVSDLPAETKKGGSRIFWDSLNQVLLWVNGGSTSPIELHVYHPARDEWEFKPTNQPEGFEVRGNNAVFDPFQNVLLLIGGYAPANPYLFLYRYGSGDGATNPIPSVTISASDTSVASGSSVTLTWTSDADSCAATGDWAGDKMSSGTETVGPIMEDSTFVLTCTTGDVSARRSILVVAESGTSGDTGGGGDTGDTGTGDSGGGVPGTDGPNMGLIQELTINDTTNIADWSVQGSFQNGVTLYGDRDYTASNVPAILTGADWIQAANDSKRYVDDVLASFRSGTQANIYIAYRDDIPSHSDWLSEYSDTGLDLESAEGPDTSQYSIYTKTVNVGDVVALGSNGDSSAGMYIVLAQPVSGADSTPDTGPGEVGGTTGSSTSAGASSDGGGGSMDIVLALILSLMLSVRYRGNYRRGC